MDLSPKKSLALCMLLAGNTSEQIAEALGMSPSGVEKIKRHQDFKLALRQSVNEIYSRAVGELSSGAIAAATRLRKIIEDQQTSTYHTILATRLLFDVLEASRRWELEQRLEKVEQLLKLQNGDVSGHMPNSQN